MVKREEHVRARKAGELNRRTAERVNTDADAQESPNWWKNKSFPSQESTIIKVDFLTGSG